MSVDPIDQAPLPAFDADRPIGAVRADDASPQVVGGQLPRAVVAGGPTDTVDALLLSVARGNHEALVALQSRMAGLVRVNVRRVLRDASRSDAVTREVFADVLEGAIHFDPHRDSGRAWLLRRAHQRAMDGLGSVDGTDDPRAARIRPVRVSVAPGTPDETSERRHWPLWSARGAPSSPTNKEHS